MGAGKSTASRLLAGISGEIIDADNEAKRMMRSDPEIKGRLVEAFGGSVVDNGDLSFCALGAIVFGSRENLLRLNAIVHPPLVRLIREKLEGSAGRNMVIDAALLPLWQLEPLFDTCIWISAPLPLRFRRLLHARSDLPENALRQRLLMQETVLAEPKSLEWTKIDNSHDLETLAGAVAPFMPE